MMSDKKNEKTKIQKYKKHIRQKIKRQKGKDKKDEKPNGKKTKREFYIVTSGQFRTFAMFFFISPPP